jgi:hypothetical protein
LRCAARDAEDIARWLQSPHHGAERLLGSRRWGHRHIKVIDTHATLSSYKVLSPLNLNSMLRMWGGVVSVDGQTMVTPLMYARQAANFLTPVSVIRRSTAKML